MVDQCTEVFFLLRASEAIIAGAVIAQRNEEIAKKPWPGFTVNNTELYARRTIRAMQEIQASENILSERGLVCKLYVRHT